jgi:DNA-binding CsgD family transcriptional regulator
LPQVARALSMDGTMAEIYQRNIMRKLSLNDAAALTEYARRIGADTA